MQSRDIHGDIHIGSVPVPPSHIPRQLPFVTRLFAGREKELADLNKLWHRSPTDSARLLVVTGSVKVGKSTLTAKWLKDRVDSYPDGQLYADLSRTDTPGEGSEEDRTTTVLGDFLMALGVEKPPAGMDQRSARWRSLTAQQRLVVFLDNVESAHQVRPFLPGSASVHIVVTSRSVLPGLRAEGAEVYSVPPLTIEAGTKLLMDCAGTRGAAETAAAREVVEHCGRLPWPIVLAGARLATHPWQSVQDLADDLSQGLSAIDELSPDGETRIRVVLDSAYEQLPDSRRSLYRRMGLLPTDRYDPFMLAAVTGDERTSEQTSAPDADVRALMEANLLHLLQADDPRIYQLHDLAQLHARARGEAEEDEALKEHVRRRFVDWCLATVATAEALLVPHHRLAEVGPCPGNAAPTPLTTADQALTWLYDYRNTLMSAIRHCATAGWHTECWQLTDLAWPLFQRFHLSEMWIEAHSLGLEAARHSGSRAGEGRMLSSGAIGLRKAGRYEASHAWNQELLELATAHHDVRAHAQALSGMGHNLLCSGQLDAAKEKFEQALRLRKSIDDRRGVAISHRRLGETALESGDLDAAKHHFEQAQDRMVALNETYEASVAQAQLGHTLIRLGRLTEGTTTLRPALARFRTGGTRSERWEAHCLEWLGDAAALAGDTTEARRSYEASRTLFQRMDATGTMRLEERLQQL